MVKTENEILKLAKTVLEKHNIKGKILDLDIEEYSQQPYITVKLDKFISDPFKRAELRTKLKKDLKKLYPEEEISFLLI